MSILDALFPPQYLREPPAFFHTRILVGPGGFLDRTFATKHNITHVINCAFDMYSPAWWRTENPTKYKVLNAVDSATTNILHWYPEFEMTLHEFLRDGTGVVYVHCQAGMNRSASLALAYSAKNLGMNLEELIASAKRQRPCLFQNRVFMDQVKQFVNGRLQSPEAEGTYKLEYHDRYARFFASGNSPNSTRHEDDAGDFTRGTRWVASGNITPVFEERDRRYY